MQLPSLAALAILGVLTGIGLWTDSADLTWSFGSWLVAGVLVATILVRPIGLWVVVPAPPILFLALVAGTIAWQRFPDLGGKKEFATAVAPWFVHAFPYLMVALGTGIVVTIVRLGRARRA